MKRYKVFLINGSYEFILTKEEDFYRLQQNVGFIICKNIKNKSVIFPMNSILKILDVSN